MIKATLFGGEHHLEKRKVPDGQKEICIPIETEKLVRKKPEEPPPEPNPMPTEIYFWHSIFPHGRRAIYVHLSIGSRLHKARMRTMRRAERYKLAWYIVEVPEFRESADPELVNDILERYFNYNLNIWIY